MEEIKKIIYDIADDVLNTSEISAGNNGPYNNIDTNARNAAHWITIFKYLYVSSGKSKYLKKIRELADYLCSETCNNATIKCFLDNPVIETNGLIGQAWVIEGLISAYGVCLDEKYYECALKMFMSQHYDFSKHLWRVVNCSDEELDFDYVFNHQLWFAASGYMIVSAKKNKTAQKELDDFTKNIERLYRCHNNGLLRHIAIVGRDPTSTLKRLIKDILNNLKYFNNRLSKLEIEKGYHLFDLYGFALLYEYSSGAININTKKFKKILKYGLDVEKNDYELKNYYGDSKMNKYAYPYNSPAFEFPYVDYIFNNSKKNEYYNDMLKFQIDKFYNTNDRLFSNKTNDPNTLTARVYELCRYLEVSRR